MTRSTGRLYGAFPSPMAESQLAPSPLSRATTRVGVRMFPGFGTVVNVITVIIGSAVGLLLGHRLPQRT